jgi:2-polyprenyl-3-methyl-5-hydroxy-6-metoxy-1,4-benzoquinol methylase
MQVISTLGDLDEKLAECEAAGRVSDDALRQVFTTFRMDFSTHMPPDPFSPEYREAQMSLYRQISGRHYHPRNEVTKFDVHAADRRPFPFYTGSCATAGFFTMGVGYLLSVLELPPGARVIEFGAGWGNTTMAMAMSGLEVTAVDIESNFCELLKLRAKRHDVQVNVVEADYMWAETVKDAFDAAIFFESFHHCSDHMRLLKALRTAVKPHGRVYLGAEPINAEFPLPWGLRMDGESLWAIRANGWMELGYNEAYFLEAAARTGWSATKRALPGLEWASVWELTRADLAQIQGRQAEDAPVAVAGSQPNVPATQDPARGEAQLRQELDAVYRSTSWRVTAPLRALASHLRRL